MTNATNKIATVLQNRNGIFFEPNETEPFTGTVVTKYESNGQKQSETNYKDGVQEGLETSWFENGQKQSEASYKDGKISSLLILWDENGQKKNEENYKNGVFVGNLKEKP